VAVRRSLRKCVLVPYGMHVRGYNFFIIWRTLRGYNVSFIWGRRTNSHFDFFKLRHVWFLVRFGEISSLILTPLTPQKSVFAWAYWTVKSHVLFTCTYYSVIRCCCFFVVFFIPGRKLYTVFDIFTYTFYSLVRISPRSLWECINETVLYLVWYG